MADRIRIRRLDDGAEATVPAGTTIPEGFEVLKRPSLAETLKHSVTEGEPGSITRSFRLAIGLDQPESPTDYALMLIPSIFATFAGGAGGAALAARAGLPAAAPAAAAIGRVLTQTAMGAGRSAVAGGDPFTEGLLDFALSSGVEALAAGAALGAVRAAGPLRGHRAAFEAAGMKPREALDALKRLFPRGTKIQVPTLSARKLTLDEVAARMGKLEGPAWQQARVEVSDALGRAKTTTGIHVTADPGEQFKAFIPEARFTPRGTEFQRVAESVLPLRTPVSVGAESLATLPFRGDIPAGVAGLSVGREALFGRSQPRVPIPYSRGLEADQ